MLTTMLILLFCFLYFMPSLLEILLPYTAPHLLRGDESEIEQRITMLLCELTGIQKADTD